MKVFNCTISLDLNGGSSFAPHSTVIVGDDPTDVEAQVLAWVYGHITKGATWDGTPAVIEDISAQVLPVSLLWLAKGS